MKLYATKSGQKVHRAECRFAKGAVEVASSGKRGFCSICKPHQPKFVVPVKGAKVHSECKVCKPGVREAAHVTTPTGSCYHKAECKMLNRKRSAVSVAKDKKVIKPIRANKGAVMASIAQALAQ